MADALVAGTCHPKKLTEAYYPVSGLPLIAVSLVNWQTCQRVN
jgi:hypothetical protein